ncbi:MAG: DUF547 domain-containing protein [Hyphomicrobium sp.]
MINRRHVILAAAASAVPFSAIPPSAVAPAHAVDLQAVDHSAFSALLAAFVTVGRDGIHRVAYRRFKADAHDRLKAYVAHLEAVAVRDLARAEQFAFWANLYNAKTIDLVLDRYPVASIKDIALGGSITAAFTGGPWQAKAVTIAGRRLSLDDIEHSELRGGFKDARVHYAVNCASFGCPNIQTRAWSAATLEADLDAAARAYVNHPRGFDVRNGDVLASSIYDWFESDFGGSAEAVIGHARRYAGAPLQSALDNQRAIAEYRYDWRLNDAPT